MVSGEVNALWYCSAAPEDVAAEACEAPVEVEGLFDCYSC